MNLSPGALAAVNPFTFIGNMSIEQMLYRMKYGKKLLRVIWLVLFAFMLSVCLVLGVTPVIPQRKEEVSIEIKMEQKERDDDDKTVLWERKEEQS